MGNPAADVMASVSRRWREDGQLVTVFNSTRRHYRNPTSPVSIFPDASGHF